MRSKDCVGGKTKPIPRYPVARNKANSQGGARGRVARIGGSIGPWRRAGVRNKANFERAEFVLTTDCRKGYGKSRGLWRRENKANLPSGDCFGRLRGGRLAALLAMIRGCKGPSCKTKPIGPAGRMAGIAALRSGQGATVRNKANSEGSMCVPLFQHSIIPIPGPGRMCLFLAGAAR